MHGTALPGEQGTMALAGHAGLRGGVFRDLGALQLGDDVVVDAGGWRYRYRIRESFRVWPTQTDVLAPSADQSLILITCTNWDTQRLIVRADLVESKPIPST
jgi:sortase A